MSSTPLFDDSLKSRADFFINKSNQIHSNRYDYSLVNYVNAHTLVTIICPTHRSV